MPGRSTGRRPKPTALKLLTGNPGKRALNAREPKPETKMPTCPPHIEGEARREWHRMGRKLLALGLLTEIDRSALAIYCQAWARWIEAEGQLKRYGPIVQAPSGALMQSPYLSIVNRAMEVMLKVLAEFGMTPSSRSRVKAAEPPREDNEFERLFRS